MQQLNRLLIGLFCIVVAFSIMPMASDAAVLRSDNFQVFDPVISVPGGRSTSASFGLLQALAQFALGTSTASSFQLNPGFLTFPITTIPVVTATAGDGQVSLSWNAATGAVGWTVSGYNVGQSTVSGGSYSYTSLGNVTSSTRTSLTNGTTYYFVIRVEDAFGNSIATSTEVSAAPVAAATPPPSPPPSGGGGIIQGLLENFGIFPVRVIEEITPEQLFLFDFNGDGIVDLTDLSILLFYTDKPEQAGSRDLNRDGRVDIIDISILLFYWGLTSSYE